MTDQFIDYLRAARYDDKIDAMHMAERNWSHHLVMLYLPNVEWRERRKVEDKRNTERLEAYRERLEMAMSQVISKIWR